ncbi:MAG TPA: methionine--tRNA ligase [Thermoanaerobaculia bacterium]|nr:methionine--tRNA ligase [Thermoanaerobaculia bacterium]
MSTRRILVSSALPYANGPIHLGHLVETTQCDVWVRLHRLLGHECYYVCADDTHGTATMLRAEAEGLTPEELIADLQTEHQQDYAAFSISFDEFHSTHSEENRLLVERFWRAFEEGGHVARRTVRQFYDPEREIFLPDRFVKGTCPRCKSPDQNGDSCDVCGATYTPQDLIEPRSVLSGATPVERDSEHLFFRLSDFEETLRAWATPERLQPEVVNKLEEWFEEGLRDWDVSREPPYFGFEIPGEPGKYFYVWVDAPIGYLATFEVLCRRKGLSFDEFLAPDSEAELHHFIGKDILYFHCLFWPAMLAGAGLRLPTSVKVHGFLTVDGAKMSKSRGTFVLARTYLEHLPADAFRYYVAAKLGPGLGDIDFNLDDFVLRINSDLVGKVVNIASRCAGFLHKRFGGRLGSALDRPELFEEVATARGEIAETLAALDTNRAVRRIMALADLANRYIDERKPWQLAKETAGPQADAELLAVLTTGINLFRVLMTYLKPIIPETAAKAEQFLNVETLAWEDAATPLLDHEISTYHALMTRIDRSAVDAMIEASKAEQAAAPRVAGASAPGAASAPADTAEREPVDPLEAEIAIDDFSKVDLRVARVLRAEPVEGADKLLRLRLDVGDHRCTVFAGIKAAYEAGSLEGRLVVVVANLAPRKMRFGVSEGMVLAAGPGGGDVFLLSPDSGAVPGQRVR